MRNFCGALLAVAFVSSSALAASGNDAPAPLAPGKPAGVNQALLSHGTGTLILLGAGAALAVVVVASSGTFGSQTPVVTTTQ